MGCFSWMTSDAGDAILIDDPTPVYLLNPFGGKPLREDNYQGYGVFGGCDAYALLAHWNMPDQVVGDDDKDRDLGIGLFFDGTAEYPLKFVRDPNVKYEDVEASDSDPDQGFGYNDQSGTNFIFGHTHQVHNPSFDVHRISDLMDPKSAVSQNEMMDSTDTMDLAFRQSFIKGQISTGYMTPEDMLERWRGL